MSSIHWIHFELLIVNCCCCRHNCVMLFYFLGEELPLLLLSFVISSCCFCMSLLFLRSTLLKCYAVLQFGWSLFPRLIVVPEQLIDWLFSLVWNVSLVLRFQNNSRWCLLTKLKRELKPRMNVLEFDLAVLFVWFFLRSMLVLWGRSPNKVICKFHSSNCF